MSDYNEKMIFGLIFNVSNQLQASIDKTLKDDSLTAKQFFLMIVISSFEVNPSLNDIAGKFGSSRQNAKQLLNKLVKNGYVLQVKDSKDKRTLRFSLTEKALNYWKQRDGIDDEHMDKLFKGMTEETTDALFLGLSQLMQNMDEMEKAYENNRHL